MIAAVIFDLDGVLLDSERLWDSARREVARAHGGTWKPEATLAMQGMSAPEWSRYMREQVGVRLTVDEINRVVLHRLLEHYRAGLPLLPGAVQAVTRLVERWPLGLASSSNRVIIDEALALAGLGAKFAVTISSEEVGQGKPAPDVYLEAATRLGSAPSACAAIEDSRNGIRSAAAAGMRVVAVPNREFPPGPEALGLASLVVDSLQELTVERVLALGGG